METFAQNILCTNFVRPYTGHLITRSRKYVGRTGVLGVRKRSDIKRTGKPIRAVELVYRYKRVREAYIGIVLAMSTRRGIPGLSPETKYIE